MNLRNDSWASPWMTMFADIASGTEDAYQVGTPWVNLADMEAPDAKVGLAGQRRSWIARHHWGV